LGPSWTDQRIDGERDPRLRERVPRERIARIWAAPTDWRQLQRKVTAFQARLEGLGSLKPPPDRRDIAERAAE
jgi:coenzyme F420-reducing hydrogenase delta subunit